MDRFDVLSAVGVLAMIFGFWWIHPGWLVVAAGYVAVTRAARNMT